MHVSAPLSRVVASAVLLSLLAAGGCSWFRKGNRLYAQSPESRPLEVPPELDPTAVERANTSAGGASVSASQARPAATASTAETLGFTIAGTRDEAFDRVDKALATVPGVTVASRARLLGAFDIGFEGASFLVRVSAVESGAYVSAVDPRGLPATGDAARKLIAQLQASLAAP